MITITTLNKELAERAEELMIEEIKYNLNLNGAEFQIEVGDYNTIDGLDAYSGTLLYNMIFNTNTI